MSWNESVGANTYALRFYEGSSLIRTVNLTAAICSGGICTIDMTTLSSAVYLPDNSTLTWNVLATNLAGSTTSDTFGLTTDLLVDTITLVSPAEMDSP